MKIQGGGSTSPETLGVSMITLYLYVTDATFSDAIKAGATETMPLENQFWGDRTGQMVDPFGHHWHIATHIEDVDPGEFQSRMEACFAAHSA
jgi:PhnB protein